MKMIDMQMRAPLTAFPLPAPSGPPSPARFARRPALALALLVSVAALGVVFRSTADPGPPVARTLSATRAAGSARVDSSMRLELVAPGGPTSWPVHVERFTGTFEMSGRRAVMTMTENNG